LNTQNFYLHEALGNVGCFEASSDGRSKDYLVKELLRGLSDLRVSFTLKKLRGLFPGCSTSARSHLIIIIGPNPLQRSMYWVYTQLSSMVIGPLRLYDFRKTTLSGRGKAESGGPGHKRLRFTECGYSGGRYRVPLCN
jgi:hypothetical protein